jgi:hypothetical protein
MLQRVPLSLPDKAIDVIEKDGGVIISDFASADQLDQVHRDVRQVMESRMGDKVSRR